MKRIISFQINYRGVLATAIVVTALDTGSLCIGIWLGFWVPRGQVISEWQTTLFLFTTATSEYVLAGVGVLPFCLIIFLAVVKEINSVTLTVWMSFFLFHTGQSRDKEHLFLSLLTERGFGYSPHLHDLLFHIYHRYALACRSFSGVRTFGT